MQEFLAFRKNFIIRLIIIVVCVAVIILITGYSEILYGYVFGSTLAVLAFLVHGQILSRAVNLPEMRATFYVVAHYMLRYTLYFIALMVSVQRSDLQFLGVVLGLVMPRLAIFLFYTFGQKE